MRKHQILTATGCYGTGSSAVTDFVKEFQHISCNSDYEVRLLHDPDGVSDLEFSLVENPNRHNSSNSIKRFIRRMQDLDHIWFIKRYAKHLGPGFLKLVNNYVKHLVQVEYYGAWHQDVFERGRMFYLASRACSITGDLLHKYLHIPLSQKKSLVPLEEKAYLPNIKEERFLSATKVFTNALADLVDKQGEDKVFMDQLVPPSNFRRYIRYFDNIRIILVDRDPRDLFILEKYIWRGRIIPFQDVSTFCKWYKWTRSLYKMENLPEEVLFIYFEDFVYHYEETSVRIMRHLNLLKKDHVYAMKFFNPDISKNNTFLWKQYPMEKENISYIENKLEQYCYHFPNNIHKEIRVKDIF